MAEQTTGVSYLEDRIVFLRPVPRKSSMVSDPGHKAYFKMEGAADRYCLKTDELTQKKINPFKDDAEMEYFSKIMGEDLNPYKANSPFWSGFYVTVVKTPELMTVGKKFDLSQPIENLQYKVLLTWKKEIAPDWDSRFNGEFRYAFVGKDYEEMKVRTQVDEWMTIGQVLGSMQNSLPKMRNFLNVYYQTKSRSNMVPEESDAAFLLAELKKIIDIDREGFLSLSEDKYFASKTLIAQAIDKDAVKRKGVGTYTIEGIAHDYNYMDLVKQFHAWAETPTEPIYAKIKAIVKAK